MNPSRLLLVAVVFVVSAPTTVQSTNMWTDILTCVNGLSNDTAVDSNSTSSAINTTVTNDTMSVNDTLLKEKRVTGDFSMMKLFSIICGDKDGFVRCLDTSLKQSSDSMAQMIGSLFDPKMVTAAYDGLCSNISAIEQGGVDVLSCLSKVKMTSCQNEMADYFFYMGVVKKFAPPSEQLSRDTMETLLCSVTFQRRQCEVRALRLCSESLAEVMEEFYTQTQPEACAELAKKEQEDKENKTEEISGKKSKL